MIMQMVIRQMLMIGHVVDDSKPMVDSRRPIFPVFRTVASAKDHRFEIGMLFTSTYQFNVAMTEYTVDRR